MGGNADFDPIVPVYPLPIGAETHPEIGAGSNPTVYLELEDVDAAGAGGDAGAGDEEDVDSVFELPDSDFGGSLFASVFDSPGLPELPLA